MAHAPPDEKTWNEFYIQLIDLIFDNIKRRNDAGKLARRLLREIDSLWVFLEVAGVEPTNNRSLCSGYHYPQDSGKSFVERTNLGFAA